MAGPTGYSILSYGGMCTSEPRMSAYAEALKQAVTPGCTVIDIGAGPGVFSLLACQYGAGQVIAIETDASVSLLPQLAADNGCADRISVVQARSTDFTPARRADVIVSDCRGGLPLFEEHIATIVDARARLLAPCGKLIPARDTVRIALAEAADDYATHALPWTKNKLGLDLSGGAKFATNSISRVKLGSDALLSDPAELVSLDYYEVEESNLSRSIELRAIRAGIVHGFVAWFDAELAPGIGYSNAPGLPPQIYRQTFLPLERPVEVSPNDRIELEITATLIDGSYVWGWNSRFFRGDATQPSAAFRQSSFLGKIISPESLRARASDFVPPDLQGAEVDRFCLSLVDGERSLGSIAEEVQATFPERFTTMKDALDHAANLTARYR